MANLKAIECWSTTVADNETTDASQSNFPTNLLSGSYKTKLWGLKASAKATIADICGFNSTTSGTSTAYVLAQSRDLDTVTTGIWTSATWHTACGADPTIAVADLGAIAIKQEDGSAISAGMLESGVTTLLRLVDGSPDTWRVVGPLSAGIDAAIDAAITAAISGSIATATSALITASLGVNTDVWTGTTNKSVTGGALVAALASVSVTMDNAMGLDLDLGRNFKASATLNTNSTISFSNERRCVVTLTFTCDSSARTLTFPSGSVTVDGFSTLTKQFAASQTHQAICYLRESGVYDWSFRENIKAAA